MIVSTTRTIASPLQKKDFKAILEMYLEPDSNTFVRPLLNKTEDFYHSFLEGRCNQNKDSIGFWVVRSQESDELIGTINLNYMDAIKGHHIGCHLRKQFWGLGYASELLSELLEYGLNVKKLKQIYGLVEKEHDVSKKMLLKIGLKYHKDFELDGCLLEQYLYQV